MDSTSFDYSCGSYQAQVSEKTQSFRELVSEYCEKYGIDDYVDLCLAVIEQEKAPVAHTVRTMMYLAES